MPIYKAPTRDTRFVLNEVLKVEQYGNLPGFENTGADMVDTVVEECGKFAAVAHDGLARAVRPVHSLLDGDTIFGVSSGRDPQPTVDRVKWMNAVLEAGARCFAAACTDAVVHATATGNDPAYRDLCPSAYPRGFLPA